MNVNLLGPFLLCRHWGAQMFAKRHGSIVNVASVAGLTRTLAAKWGVRGVRVNAVCARCIKTEMDADASWDNLRMRTRN